MNYKGAILNEIRSMMTNYPDMSFGQILHSFTRRSVLGTNLYEATDKQVYNAIEKANEYEAD